MRFVFPLLLAGTTVSAGSMPRNPAAPEAPQVVVVHAKDFACAKFEYCYGKNP